MSIKIHTVEVIATIDGEWRRVRVDVDDDHHDPLLSVYDRGGLRAGDERAAVLQPRLKGVDAASVRLALFTSRQATRLRRMHNAAKAGG